MAGVPNLGHACHPEPALAGEGPPQLNEVELFFTQKNYPTIEAQKFFNHYQSNGWLVGGKTPMKDWQSSAHKWMLNANQWNHNQPGEAKEPVPQVLEAPGVLQGIYEDFLLGHRIFKHITPEHCTQLNLELTEELMQAARTERINQVSGTNQHSLSQLWDAYLQGKEDNILLTRDKPNLINLAMRIAVFKHFRQLKQDGVKTLIPP